MSTLYQTDETPTDALWLFEHVLGDQAGWMVTFAGRQARIDDPDARQNELARIEQRSWRYPGSTNSAAKYLLSESGRGRDAYFGVHLFREPGDRKRTNATGAMSCLWLDEDDGRFPEIGPEPTAIVHSSGNRRHLYWQLTRRMSAEWCVGMNRRLAAWSGGDIGKAGLSSVLRVPGTANYKRHPRVDLVHLEITGVPAWSPEVIEQSVPLLPEPTTTAKKPRSGAYAGPRLDLIDYLEAADIEVLDSVSDGGGTKFAVICPWIAEHSGGDRTGTLAGQFNSGAMWFHCHHAHCSERRWREFRREVSRPQHRVRPMTLKEVNVSYGR